MLVVDVYGTGDLKLFYSGVDIHAGKSGMIRLKTFNADDRKLWVVINQRKESMAGIFQDSYWIPTGFLLFTRYIAPRH